MEDTTTETRPLPPLRKAITNTRLREIAEAYFVDGTPRPTYTDLTERFACSRSTVSRAIAMYGPEFSDTAAVDDGPGGKFARKLYRLLRERYNGWTSNEIALSMNVDVEAVRVALQRLRKAKLARAERLRWFYVRGKGR